MSIVDWGKAFATFKKATINFISPKKENLNRELDTSPQVHFSS
jgi:hypothetical protein